MNEKQYNDLAKDLEQQLNKKCTLGAFHVLDAIEFLMKYAPENQKKPDRFAAEFHVKTNDSHLKWYALLSVELITNTYVNVIVDFIIKEMTDSFSHVIRPSGRNPRLD